MGSAESAWQANEKLKTSWILFCHLHTFRCTTIQPYKVLLLTCVANCTAGMPMPRLCSVVQWSVHWALSWTTWVLVLAGARRCALETCRKKMRALLLGLAKSIYYCLHIPLDKTCKHHLHMKGQMQWKLILCFPVSIGLLPVKWFFWKNQISFLCIPLFKLFIKHFVFFWNIIQDIK